MPIQSDINDISDISTEGVFTLQDIKALFWVDGEFTFHPCGICGYSKLTAWKAETFKGQLFWICEDCKQEWEKQPLKERISIVSIAEYAVGRAGRKTRPRPWRP